MLGSAQQHACCVSLFAGVRALITLHTVCSMEPNKLECQSQTHLWVYAASLIMLINDTEPQWKRDTVMDSPTNLMKLEVFLWT